jgi:hypothetical protein
LTLAGPINIIVKAIPDAAETAVGQLLPTRYTSSGRGGHPYTVAGVD